MNSDLFEALGALEKEKGISQDYMLERVEAALVSAYKRDRNGLANVRVEIDKTKQTIRMFEQKTVVEEVTDEEQEIALVDALKINRKYVLGSVCETELKPKNFRRLSAQTAKQVIIQGIREAERSMMIKEYESKKEEIITAIVDKVDPENEDVLVDTGTSKVYLKKAEQIPGEHFNVGDHIKVFVTEVMKESLRGPLVSLSRTAAGLVKRLFELEIPEIQDGTVVIMSITREAGSRTKMAVMSRDENVDPIGSCIGNKGMRIQNIVNELRGEKIDIVKYSEDPVEYIAAALSPAHVKEVVIDSEKSCRVVVDSDQLSLAIGKEGQNARLAARLTGFKIDIKTKSDLEAEEAAKQAFIDAAEEDEVDENADSIAFDTDVSSELV
ncbi:MAG: transcription termination/antitermination protein NusA [Clostridiales bacterium]|nr:transcription termination/antitermination protein NusA [Clostridiales bacterium]